MSLSETPLSVNAADVQAHYDTSEDSGLFRAFLDRTLTYSCAYFETGNETLEQAQIAKIHHSLRKLNLQPRQRLLDIGSGWGETVIRGKTYYVGTVVGLTLSENQFRIATARASDHNFINRGVEFKLEGWEEHQGEYDAIISIGAFEHFGRKKHPFFFRRIRELEPDGGMFLLHTIHFNRQPKERMKFGRHSLFIAKKVFPGGELTTVDSIEDLAQAAGLELMDREALGPHYSKTLAHWSANLDANRDQAVAATDERTVATYKKYLDESKYWFDQRVIDVSQFRFKVPSLQELPLAA